MTCIVGIETDEGVLLGADSMAGDPVYWTADITLEPKVFRVGEYMIGFTTSFRMGELLRYHLVLPSPPKTNLYKHLVTAAVPAIRACLKDGGYATTKDGAEVGGDFLIAVRGRLYHVQTSYHVGRSPHGYDAAGVGAQAALGALYASVGREPRERLKFALEAAERHNMGVRKPWRFVAERRP